jgi:outer membrane immunogenic protein
MGGAIMKKFALGILIALTGANCATAADLYYKAPVAVPVYNWTGFYIGGNVGGAWGNFDPTTSTVFSPVGYFATSSVPAINAAGIQSSKPSGVTGGFEAGYNWKIRNFDLGVEGDLEALSLSNSMSSGAVYPCCAPTAFTVTSNVSTTWLATIRGRLGYAVNNWLFFVTGGAAFTDLRGNFAFSDTFANAAESASFSDTKTGYTVGGGVEAGLWLPAHPLLRDEGRELLDRAARRLGAERAQPLLHVGLAEDAIDFGIEPHDDFARGARWRHDGVPRA